MQNNWRHSTWGEEISLEYGKSLRDYDTSKGKYRVFGSNGPIGWTDTFLAEGPGIILGRKGAYRGTQFARESFFVIDTAYFVQSKNNHDVRWLYYAIKHHKLGEIDDGSPIPSTTRSAVYVCELDVPPASEQRAIAHVLGSLDDKIELNRQMNETLEEMARTLFRSWFVDFDPVRAKAEGRQPQGMDAETAALFPSEFVESELGMIPKGWEVRSLPEVIDINPSRKLAKGEIAPYLDMGNMPTSSARAIEVYDREFGSGMKFQNGDTLVARITPCLENGKTAFVDFLEDNHVGWGSTEYIVLRPKSPLPNEFAYFLARTEEFRAFAISNMTGSSGRQRVPADCFSNYKIAVPTANITQAFGQVVQVFLTQMKLHDEQSATLAEQRQQLLPKLISGEIRLPDDMIAEFEE
jgi:type I restriction enzyme, S subunit